jgi:hypothetical protein
MFRFWRRFYLIIKNLFSGLGQISMALPVKILSGIGVLEYWSIGVLEKAKP